MNNTTDQQVIWQLFQQPIWPTSNGTHLLPPPWMIHFDSFRKRLFLQTIEPIIVSILGPIETDYNSTNINNHNHIHRTWIAAADGQDILPSLLACENCTHFDDDSQHHRRLGFFPSYITTANTFVETSMSFATLIMLFVTLTCVFIIFLSCFYHNQKTSPLFISPRRHRLPKLVPPPLPVDGYLSWVKVCFFLSDEEIIHRIGYDSLIFLRFHRLALRCIVKMSVFSFMVLLPLNFTGKGPTEAQDLKEYVGKLLLTDFLKFTMANVKSGSPRFWVHCFAAYLLTGIVVRELLYEYEAYHAIRHRYLLSQEPHLRTVLVTNIPRHLRSARKITNYFRHVYPQAVQSVFLCQNLLALEKMVSKRTRVLSSIEKELLMLCRAEKKKLYEPSQAFWRHIYYYWRVHPYQACRCCWLEECGVVDGAQERLAKLYSRLEDLNSAIEREQQRRMRVMKMLDRMEAGEGSHEIDYVLASPFVAQDDPAQRRVLGLPPVPEKPSSLSSSRPSSTSLSSMSPAAYVPPSINTVAPGGVGGVGVDEVEPSLNDLEAITTSIEPAVEAGRLRARSPAVAEEKAVGGGTATTAIASATHDPTDRKKAHAKSAIRRYSKFTTRKNSFFGRPIRSQVEVQSEGKIEDHINEVTDKAFVVMRTFTAATIAIQSMHSSKPGSMQVCSAPEPRDILWNNIYLSKGAHRTRSYLGEFLVLLIITFYVVPVALVSLLVSESGLVNMSPRLQQLDEASALFSMSIALVQPLCIVGIQQLLPPLFMLIGEAEGITSFSEVQMRAFSRYFLFQVLNVFLVTTIAGTIFDAIATIIETPESAFEMLGYSLPRMSSFFITFVTIKAFLALGFELVRTMALVQGAFRYIIHPNATLRMKRNVIVGMRAIDDPGWFPFHKILAQDMLVVVISVVFAVVAPLVLLPCALFCLFSRIMWTHHHMFVYESVFESGGQFWPKIFRRFVFGLIIAQMTITGQFILKDARHEAYATMALSMLTYFFLRSTRARYDPTSSTLPLEVATVMDISLQQEEEARNTEDARRREAAGMRGSESVVPPSTTSITPRHDLGSRVGQHDPFQKAYLQPALRANPRARPEQPFPAAQLGRLQSGAGLNSDAPEETSEEDCRDTAATVRLKSLNQNDRRLINRWWNDQLQRAGDQHLLQILIGEECGTLTLSGPSMVDAELHESPSSASHVMV